MIYIGTFSRTIFSALRIGYMIVPNGLLDAFVAAKWLCDRHTATLEQETLAEFISSGIYERYLRRMRRKNAARRKALLEAISLHLGDRVEVRGDGAGAHVVLWPRTEDQRTGVDFAGCVSRRRSLWNIRLPHPEVSTHRNHVGVFADGRDSDSCWDSAIGRGFVTADVDLVTVTRKPARLPPHRFIIRFMAGSISRIARR